MLTYLNIDVVVVVSPVDVSGIVELVPQLLDFFSGKPHAERRLEFDDNPDLARGVVLSIQGRAWVKIEFLSIRLIGATASLSH